MSPLNGVDLGQMLLQMWDRLARVETAQTATTSRLDKLENQVARIENRRHSMNGSTMSPPFLSEPVHAPHPQPLPPQSLLAWLGLSGREVLLLAAMVLSGLLGLWEGEGVRAAILGVLGISPP